VILRTTTRINHSNAPSWTLNELDTAPYQGRSFKKDPFNLVTVPGGVAAACT
jgi:hypothetical protein